MRLRHLILIPMLGWAALALFVTTQPGSHPLVQWLNHTIAQNSLGGAIGHGGLFAVLTIIGYCGLRMWCNRAVALALAMLVALTVGTGTEFYQLLVDGRNATLVDLLANWLGVFMVGFALVSGMLIVPRPRAPFKAAR